MSQRKNNKNSNFSESVKSAIWFFIVAGAILAFFNLSNGDTGNIVDKAKNGSIRLDKTYQNCFKEGFPGCLSKKHSIPSLSNNNPSNDSDSSSSKDLSTSESTSEISEKDNLINKLNNLNIVSAYDKVSYKRTEWKHWINYNGSSCWNTREEALYRQAVPNSIVLLDSSGKETKDKNEACSIKSGEWKDPYTNEIIKDPTKTDLDHTSPLAATARAGGQAWDKNKKEEFANDLDHLVVTSQKANRQKGDKTPSEWMPENKDSWCNYSKIYINILSKYNLNITEQDKDVLEKTISSCQF